jgi:kinesin family protein 23
VENQSLKRQLDSNDSQVNKIHRRVQSLEKANEALQRTAIQFEQEKKTLAREVCSPILYCCMWFDSLCFELDDKEYRMRRALTEKDQLKYDFRAKLALTEQELGRQIEQAKRKLKDESQVQLRAKQQKLVMLRSIINYTDTESVTSQSSVGTPAARPRSRTVTSRYLATTGSNSSRIIPACSEPDLSMIGSSAGSMRPPTTRPKTPFTQPVNKAVPRTT